MDDRLILKAIKTILVIHEVHVNDDDGDKFLSDPNLAIQAIDQVAYGYFYQAVKDGFLTQEIVNNAIQPMEMCAHCDGPLTYTTGKWSKNGKTYCCPACQLADQ